MKSTKRINKNLLITRQDKLISFEIFQVLQDVTGIDQRLFINNRSRTRRTVMLRQIAAYLMIKYTTMSLADIGFLIGGFDHSSIVHSRDLVNDWVENPKYYSTECSIITEAQNILSEKYEQRNNSNIQTSVG